MATTDNLSITLIETMQSQKEVTANEAFTKLDGAIAGSSTVTLADGANTVDTDVYQENFHFILGGTPTGATTTKFPAFKHLIIAKNSSGQATTLSTSHASSVNNIALANGEQKLLYNDGTNLWEVSSAGGGAGSDTFVGLTDTPDNFTGQALKVVRVNASENALEFAAASTNTFVALDDTPANYTGAALKGVRVNAAGTGLEFYTVGAGADIAELVDLQDGPMAYTGAALQFLRVTALENGFEFTDINFTDLADVPATLTGQELKTVRVNVTGDALEFFNPSFLDLANTPNSYTGFGGMYVMVSNTEDGLEFVDLPSNNPKQSLMVAIGADTSVVEAGTAVLTFRMPFAFVVTEIRANLVTAQTSGSIITIDVKEDGWSMFSTLLTIDNGEKTSESAATAAVLSDTIIADDKEMTIDVTQVGDGTAAGLKVTIIGYAQTA